MIHYPNAASYKDCINLSIYLGEKLSIFYANNIISSSFNSKLTLNLLANIFDGFKI